MGVLLDYYHTKAQLLTEMLHQNQLDAFSPKAIFNVMNSNIIHACYSVEDHRDELC